MGNQQTPPNHTLLAEKLAPWPLSSLSVAACSDTVSWTCNTPSILSCNGGLSQCQQCHHLHCSCLVLHPGDWGCLSLEIFSATLIRMQTRNFNLWCHRKITFMLNKKVSPLDTPVAFGSGGRNSNKTETSSHLHCIVVLAEISNSGKWQQN